MLYCETFLTAMRPFVRHFLVVLVILWISPNCFAAEFPEATLEDFKSENFRTRESAQESLLDWARKNPKIATDRLFVLSQTADNPEVRERCLAVLGELIGDEYLKGGEGYIGIRMQDELAVIPGEQNPRGVIRVLQVVPASPAHAAGLKLNDLIAGLNEQIWMEGGASKSFMQIIRELRPSTQVTLRVLRDGKMIDIPVKLGRRPLFADNPFLDEKEMDLEAAEKAAKEAYFRRWLEARKARN